MKVVTMPHWKSDEELTVTCNDVGVYLSTERFDLLMDKTTARQLARTITYVVDPPPLGTVIDNIDFAAIVNTEEE